MGSLFKGLLKNELGFDGTLVFNNKNNNHYKELFSEAQIPRYLISTSKQEMLKEILEKNNIDYKILGTTNLTKTISFNNINLDMVKLKKAFTSG